MLSTESTPSPGSYFLFKDSIFSVGVRLRDIAYIFIQVFCQHDSSCVPRLAFSCGDKSCEKNEKLCGSLRDMNCIPGDRECPRRDNDRADNGRNSSLPFPPQEGVNVGSRPSRQGDDDDNNPFSRGPPDGRHDFDWNATRSVLNETKLKRMLRRSFNPSFIDEIIGIQSQANGSFANSHRSDRDACTRRYSSCVKTALANLMFLNDLNGECCKMVQEPQHFAQMLHNISRKFSPRRMDCPRGSRFCPFSFVLNGNGCIPMRGNISSGFKNDSDDGISTTPITPGGSNPRKDSRFARFS